MIRIIRTGCPPPKEGAESFSGGGAVFLRRLPRLSHLLRNKKKNLDSSSWIRIRCETNFLRDRMKLKRILKVPKLKGNPNLWDLRIGDLFLSRGDIGLQGRKGEGKKKRINKYEKTVKGEDYCFNFRRNRNVSSHFR